MGEIFFRIVCRFDPMGWCRPHIIPVCSIHIKVHCKHFTSIPVNCFLGVFREATTDFTVDARALSQTGGDRVKALISNPSGSHTDALITDLGDGTYNVEYTPYEEGEVIAVCCPLWMDSPSPGVWKVFMCVCFRPTQRGGLLRRLSSA